ncbi:peptidoglycan-binding protein [Moorena sp. SIO3I8]|uniref:peptidoglycan-binding protein n=1 Tax=Moorena sp. SIO3I8 TaxID=2607833 RepID=UPI0013C141A6|nr:peptidoglycan-binding protein [Moorena sp. SIO3I8]NEO09783.1 peptidoglycan-binding protein [Moorena sp. SIO3I8]
MAIFRILGRVIDPKTSGVVSGLRVEAWDKDLIFNNLVGRAITDDHGSFGMEFDESYFQELFADQRPDIFFKVFCDQQLIKSTEDSVLWNLDIGETEVLITVDNYSKNNVYEKYLQAAVQGSKDNPKLLYLGIKTSPYKQQIKDYPSRLTQKPDGKHLVSVIKADKTFSPYPILGQLPDIDQQGLEFIHQDIKEACVCVGSFVDQEFKVKWLGRNALSNDELWSGSKIIPIINLVSRLNSKSPNDDLDKCTIRGRDQAGNQRDIPVCDLITDVISYDYNTASSNCLGAMLKRFAPQMDLENWLKQITGNDSLIFRGRYGEKPFIEYPQLFGSTTKRIILTADPEPPQWESNTISAYDLNRMISMVGWHNYIPEACQLPGVKWDSLESIIRAMANDPARLVDLAIKELGLLNVIDSTVIISKLGNGVTSIRNRTEAVYVALVKLVKPSLDDALKPAKLITFSMALRGAKVLEPRDFNREAVELDARIATEVTEILRRAVMGELV